MDTSLREHLLLHFLQSGQVQPNPAFFQRELMELEETRTRFESRTYSRHHEAHTAQGCAAGRADWELSRDDRPVGDDVLADADLSSLGDSDHGNGARGVAGEKRATEEVRKHRYEAAEPKPRPQPPYNGYGSKEVRKHRYEAAEPKPRPQPPYNGYGSKETEKELELEHESEPQEDQGGTDDDKADSGTLTQQAEGGDDDEEEDDESKLEAEAEAEAGDDQSNAEVGVVEQRADDVDDETVEQEKVSGGGALDREVEAQYSFDYPMPLETADGSNTHNIFRRLNALRDQHTRFKKWLYDVRYHMRFAPVLEKDLDGLILQAENLQLRTLQGDNVPESDLSNLDDGVGKWRERFRWTLVEYVRRRIHTAIDKVATQKRGKTEWVWKKSVGATVYKDKLKRLETTVTEVGGMALLVLRDEYQGTLAWVDEHISRLQRLVDGFGAASSLDQDPVRLSLRTSMNEMLTSARGLETSIRARLDNVNRALQEQEVPYPADE